MALGCQLLHSFQRTLF